MENKATSWIHAGIKVLSRTGKLELNEVCRERGKFKPSFYHIYPNDDNSRGLDRFEKDLLNHHKGVLLEFFEQTRKMYIIYTMPEIIEEFVNKLEEYYHYHCCSAHIRKLAQADDEIKEYWDNLYTEYLSLFNDFYKVYNIPENLTFDDLELRLLFDSLLTFENEEFIEDCINIISSRLKFRQGEF